MGNYAGVDWASEKNDVLVCDEAGEELLAATFAHDEAGLRSLCRALVRARVELVAIERPNGVLVDRLLDVGLRVLALHPNQVAAARARFRASGGKSDRFDAFVICELARTDSHRFRVLEPDSDQTKAIKALTRAREDLVRTRVALANQLRSELERFWPGPVGLFSSLDSPISLAFLKRYPSPLDARKLGVQRLATFLRNQRYSGGKAPAELLEKLRAAAVGCAGETEMHAGREIALALVATLSTLGEQVKQLDRQIAVAVRAHPDGEIFLSLFKGPDSVLTAATLLAEIGDCRAATPPASRLRATPAKRLWRSSPASTRSLATAGRATSGSATRSARSLTAPVTGTPGPLTATPPPAPAARTTSARSAPSGALGAASCGAAGKTPCRMTSPCTTARSSTSRFSSRPHVEAALTFPPPSGWPATLSAPAWTLALCRAARAQRNLHRQKSGARAGSQRWPVRAERSEPRSGGP